MPIPARAHLIKLRNDQFSFAGGYVRVTGSDTLHLTMYTQTVAGQRGLGQNGQGELLLCLRATHLVCHSWVTSFNLGAHCSTQNGTCSEQIAEDDLHQQGIHDQPRMNRSKAC